MKKPLLYLLIMTGLFLGIAACGEELTEEEKTLCACVQRANGEEWDMHLSPGCIELSLDKFGTDLEGMERWFQEHCDLPDFEHPPLNPGKDAPVQI